jgi:hypothetical protein
MFQRLIQALWLGSGAFILIAAPAIFRAAETPANAANVVGAVLSRWHYISLIAPALLMVIEWRNARGRIVAVLFAAVILASTQALVDMKIRSIRANSPTAISALSREDPVRRRFGMLHGISSLLLIAQVIAAASAIILDSRN